MHVTSGNYLCCFCQTPPNALSKQPIHSAEETSLQRLETSSRPQVTRMHYWVLCLMQVWSKLGKKVNPLSIQSNLCDDSSGFASVTKNHSRTTSPWLFPIWMVVSNLLGNLPEATPQRGVAAMELDTIPASETQVVESLKGSPRIESPSDDKCSVGAPGGPCPTSPASSVPSSAGNSGEAIWLEFMNICSFFRCVARPPNKNIWCTDEYYTFVVNLTRRFCQIFDYFLQC